MGKIDLKTAAKTWRFMVENNQALLARKSGLDTAWWAAKGRAAGLTRVTNSCVDVTLRIDAPAEGGLEAVMARAGGLSTRRFRLRADAPVTQRSLPS